MSDSNNFLRVKRGRPRKNRQLDCLGDSFKPKLRKSESEAQFQYFQFQYINNDFNQKMKIMILRFLDSVRSKIVYNISLLVLFEDSIKEMMVTEIEFCAFAVIFSKLDLNYLKIPIEELLKLCLFSVKVKFESRIEVIENIETKLEIDIIEFKKKLTIYTLEYDVTVREINKYLNKLTDNLQIGSINYSFYIDEIIRLSPPYKPIPKESKLFSKSDKIKKKPMDRRKNVENKSLEYNYFEKLEILSENDVKQLRMIKGNSICKELDNWELEVDSEYQLEKLV